VSSWSIPAFMRRVCFFCCLFGWAWVAWALIDAIVCLLFIYPLNAPLEDLYLVPAAHDTSQDSWW